MMPTLNTSMFSATRHLNCKQQFGGSIHQFCNEGATHQCDLGQ